MGRSCIKESCSCGAMLIFEEVTSNYWEERTSSLQRDFHQEHKVCRNKLTELSDKDK